MSANPIQAGGTVAVGSLRLHVEPLSTRQELALRRQLADIHRTTIGRGGFFARAKPSLDWMRENGMTAEWSLAVQEITRMSASGDDPGTEAIDDARRSRPGVVAELYARTRRTHPEVKPAELEAVVTEAIAEDVHEQIVRAVTDEKKAPTPSGS